MKIKIVGFKVGQSRPTANRTLTIRLEGPITWEHLSKGLGIVVLKILGKSDFVSIRRVDD